jgi:hypothetical protein
MACIKAALLALMCGRIGELTLTKQERAALAARGIGSSLQGLSDKAKQLDRDTVKVAYKAIREVTGA